MLDKVAQQITSFFSSIILVIKKKNCRNDKFDFIFFLVYSSEILTEITSQNEATAPLNRDRTDLLRTASK